MSILARIRVREAHGMRRFLYPLSTALSLPDEIDTTMLSLTTPEGEAVPHQVIAPQFEDSNYRLDFAVSLDPFAERELWLSAGGGPAVVADAIHLAAPDEDLAVRSTQQNLHVGLGWDGSIQDIRYFGIAHLRSGSEIVSHGAAESEDVGTVFAEGSGLLTAWVIARGKTDHGSWETRSEMTACKSWIKIRHRREGLQANDTVTFRLPLAIASPTLTCDFGAGGGIYGKLQSDGPQEIVWRSIFEPDGTVSWSLAAAGRVDYVGSAAKPEEYAAQRWFHVIDSDKALAVAITTAPSDCRLMTITLNVRGDVEIAFTLGESVNAPAEFEVCYHFLNAVPPLSAATNPQSILQQPIVEAEIMPQPR